MRMRSTPAAPDAVIGLRSLRRQAFGRRCKIQQPARAPLTRRARRGLFGNTFGMITCRRHRCSVAFKGGETHMRSSALFIAAILATIAATPSSAESTFQNSCSEIGFVYNLSAAGAPTLKATCLTTGGGAIATSLTLKGISNENGFLTRGSLSNSSTFQQTCGNIHIAVIDTEFVRLEAFCRENDGTYRYTTLGLNNISNQNGILQQSAP